MGELAILSDQDWDRLGEAGVPALPNGKEAHGRRYTSAEREAAFTLWARLDPPSLPRASALLGISERTLDRWAKDDAWAARLAALRGDDTLTSVVSGAVTRIDLLTDKLLDQTELLAAVALVRVLTDPKSRDVVRAIELALGLRGRVVPKHTINQRGPDLDAGPPTTTRALIADALANDPALAAYLDPTPTPHPPGDLCAGGEAGGRESHPPDGHTSSGEDE